jgi:hypothetical protein
VLPHNRTDRENAGALEEDEMYLVLPQQLAAQHIAELHEQAARQRLIRELRARPERAARHRRRMRRLLLRRPRPAAA